MKRYPAVVVLVLPILFLLSSAKPVHAFPGDLDFGFGTHGIVLADFDRSSKAKGVALQTDGKIVVAGYTFAMREADFALARFDSKGLLDPAFNAGGLVTTDFGTYDQGAAVAIQADGKIVVAGTSSNRFAVARYDTQGLLDTAFGSSGTVTTFGGGAAGHGIAIQANQKIVVAGASSGDFALARYDTNGVLDTGFGTGGIVTTDFGGDACGYAIAIQTDGKILVAGNSSKDFALARYDDGGNLDPGFGVGGKVTADSGGSDEGYALALQSDGKVVVAGASGGDFALARFDTHGVLDPAFGTGGIVTTDVGGSDRSFAIAVQSDGKLVAVGVGPDDWSNSGFAVARYEHNGSLDLGFGVGGKVITSFGHIHSGHAEALTIQADGKIVVAGSSSEGGFTLARYIGRSPWDDAVVYPDGWRGLEWFGFFNISVPPWIYHANHGWLYALGDDTDNLVFWDCAMNAYWWTSAPYYPHVYHFASATWLYYHSGSTPYRWFYNYLTGQWEVW